MDNISLPAVKGIVSPNPDQQVIDPGVLLMCQPGDPVASTRPIWSKNGTILVYRHFNQLMPEYNQFKRDNALFPVQLGIEKGAELLGARLFGRWKSGRPFSLHCHHITGILMLRISRGSHRRKSYSRWSRTCSRSIEKQQFRLFHNEFPRVIYLVHHLLTHYQPQDQTNCPFAADELALGLGGNTIVAPHTINRAGITFGEEVTPAEHSQHKAEHDRGRLLYAIKATYPKGLILCKNVRYIKLHKSIQHF